MMRWNTWRKVEMRKRGKNDEMEHLEKGGNEEKRKE